MNAITLSGLYKRFGAFVALDGVDLTIPAGCVFGLLGPNGAGKTTTFKCMLGLVRVTSGTVAFDGAPLTPATFEHIGYIPERSVLYDWMTVREHIEYMRHSFARFDPSKAHALLEQLGVGDDRKRVRALSKGMRTATAVALAFARQPDILILDEPTSGLDPINQRTVLNLIINEAARGATILFSSHQIGQVERAAERIGVMQHGRIVLEGSVDDLKAGRKIVEGILPSEAFAIDGFAANPNIDRIERSGRVVRAFVHQQPDAVAADLTQLGAGGIRVVDLNLEDIFLDAVSPGTSTASVVEEA
ncbi:MAG: ABC transporter ATP-binding protein [Vulcanimicrobiaceae bacterium]